MLIKIKDDDSALLKELELRAAGTGTAARQAATELRIRQAGLKGERDSAYHIDFHFERSPNWAVIHDLRLERDGRVAQIDHLLINRWLEIYVLETKHFHAGIKITSDGEFLAGALKARPPKARTRRRSRTNGISRC
ncbi:nuclease-related domain-containing protein [Lysobacter enzymogenes]|uniref:nuclease-related domain-containing protein n=1 Tax=Lysobacter enzymogenes TaxID=69 RepID=UPI0008999A13|nr:nuclease-related domain-containing protein [Lysobacter enzymogenes]SDX20984.1 Nuclease-related domain-containing protein [Lysobacter enzymogenes]